MLDEKLEAVGGTLVDSYTGPRCVVVTDCCSASELRRVRKQPQKYARSATPSAAPSPAGTTPGAATSVSAVAGDQTSRVAAPRQSRRQLLLGGNDDGGALDTSTPYIPSFIINCVVTGGDKAVRHVSEMLTMVDRLFVIDASAARASSAAAVSATAAAAASNTIRASRSVKAATAAEVAVIGAGGGGGGGVGGGGTGTRKTGVKSSRLTRTPLYALHVDVRWTFGDAPVPASAREAAQLGMVELTGPCTMKLERLDGRYRPWIKEFPREEERFWRKPHVNLNTPAGHCPFRAAEEDIAEAHATVSKRASKVTRGAGKDERRGAREAAPAASVAPAEPAVAEAGYAVAGEGERLADAVGVNVRDSAQAIPADGTTAGVLDASVTTAVATVAVEVASAGAAAGAATATGEAAETGAAVAGMDAAVAGIEARATAKNERARRSVVQAHVVPDDAAAPVKRSRRAKDDVGGGGGGGGAAAAAAAAPKPAARKSGYCEVCECQYQDLEKHRLTGAHQDFANNPRNFVLIDSCERFFRARDYFKRLQSTVMSSIREDEVCVRLCLLLMARSVNNAG